MRRRALPNSREYVKNNKRHRAWQKVVSTLGCVVVFCTTYALILPAITMENPTTCEQEVHTHSETCYVQDTSVHEHTESCYQIPEDTGHEHTTDECYIKEKGSLICLEAEAHFHNEACQGGSNLICAQPETQGHAHGETCYASQLTCTEATEIAHEHNDNCYVNSKVCGLSEGEEHTHSGDCYASTLNCSETAQIVHTHGDGCYTTSQVCGQTEGEGHAHGEACYEVIAPCTLTEGEGHVHVDSCYQWNYLLACSEEEAEPVLVCDQDEDETAADEQTLTCQLAEDDSHTHNFLCYGAWQLVCEIEEHTHELACFSDPEADVETEEVWKRTLPDKLTGVYVDDLLAAAESQLDYTESKNNYTVLDDGVTTKGYTRYGDWYGDPYGDWDGMFASFCLYYAGANELEALEDFPLEASPAEWVRKLTEDELFLNAEDGTPEPGDLVFFNYKEDELNEADHVGIVIEVFEEEAEDAEQEMITKLRIYEGDVEDQVQENEYELNDPAILGYGLLPAVPDYDPYATTEETEISGNVYTYSDDSVYVEVQLPVDTTVPADAVLTVTPIAADHESYDAYLVQAEEAVDGTVANIALYDISFYSADGSTYIPVSDTAKVTMGFTESPVDQDAEIQILHFEEEEAAPRIIAEVGVAEKEIEMLLDGAAEAEEPAGEPTEEVVDEAVQISLFSAFSLRPAAETEAAQETEAAEEPETVTETRTVIEFTTDGFSTFAVVEVAASETTYTTTILTDFTNLNGKTVLLSTANAIQGADGNTSNRALSSNNVYTTTEDNEFNLLEAVTVQNDGTSVTAATDSIDELLWQIEVATDANGATCYYFKSVATGMYLYLGDGQFVRLVSEPHPIYATFDEQNRVILRDGLNAGRYLSFDESVTPPAFSVFNNPGERHLLVLSEFTETTPYETKILSINQVYADANAADTHPLDGMTVAISSKTELNGEYRLVTTDGTALVAGTATQNEDNTSVYLDPNDINEAFWTFTKVEGENKANTYYIESVQYPGMYLYINDLYVELSNTKKEVQVWYNAQGGNFTENELRLKDPAHNRWLSYNMDAGFAGYQTPTNAENGARASLVFSQDSADYTEETENKEYVGDLGNQYYIIAGVNFGNNSQGFAMSHTSITVDAQYAGLQGQPIGDVSSGTVELTGYSGLIWFFEETGTAGQYYIQAVNIAEATGEAEFVGYINLLEDNAQKLVLTETPQALTVINAPGLQNNDIQTAVNIVNGTICINQYKNNTEYGFTGWEHNTTGRDAGSHLALVEFEKVNEVTDILAELTSQLTKTVADDGTVTYTFNELALTGSATAGNGDENQGDGIHIPDFVAAYDSAQEYRTAMQELARKAKTLYDQLSEEEKAYVDYICDLDDLKWLWNEIQAVENNAKPLATVKLFNYSDGTNGKPDINSYELADEGFNFYHKNQYDAYTAEYVTTRENSGAYGCDNSALNMTPVLVNGMPEVSGGWKDGAEADLPANVDGSLDYLFSETVDGAANPNYVTTMENGGGLFQYDPVTGYYYYHSNQNAAHWDEDKNEFVLYDTIVRPMYVPAGEKGSAVGANNNEDRYNFLPFDDPANTAITDQELMDVEWTLANGEHREWEKPSAYLNERPDMWFGMTVHTTFFMPANGEVRNPQGEIQNMVFKFHGDDDTLIYINGVLVVDIGGVHGAEDGIINFATGEVTFEDSNGTKGTRGTVTMNIKDLMIENLKAMPEHAGKSDDQILDVLKNVYGIEFEDTDDGGTTLKQFATYDMDFFYMERGGNVSYCGIEYNLVEIPSNSLSVGKEVDADTDDDGFDDAIDTNLTYTFRVMQVDANGNATNVPFIKNTTYTIRDEANNVVGSGIVGEDGYFTLKEGQRAVFSDIVDPYKGGTVPDYVVQEILPNGEVGQYEVSYTCIGTQTEVTQLKDSPIKVHTTFQTEPIRVSGEEAQVVTFTNTVVEPTGSLQLQKKLENGRVSDEEFTFKIETGGISSAVAIAAADDDTIAVAEYSKIEKGTLYELYTVTIGADGKEVLTPVTQGAAQTNIDEDGVVHYYFEVTSTDGTITLKPNQRAVFEGILAGTYFKISEVLGEDQHYAASYYGEILNKDEIDEKTTVYYDASGAYGVFTQDGADVLVTVTNNDSLTNVSFPIHKTIPNHPGADSFEIDTVRLSSVQINGNTLTYSTQSGAAGEDNTQDAANPIVSVTNGTGDGSAIFNFVLADVNTSADEYKYYFRLTEKVDNKKSYIYDKTIYVVEVTLTKGTDDNGKTNYTGKVTNVWKNDGTATGDNITCTLVENATSLDFVNYRYTRVFIQKFVAGEVNSTQEFDFEATVSTLVNTAVEGLVPGEKSPFNLTLIPENIGSGLTIGEETNKATFSISHGQGQTLYVPYGAYVTVKETSGTGYYTSYKVGSGTQTSGNETPEITVTDPITVVFNNEKTTSVTISKSVENGTTDPTFTFNAVITYPDGTKHTVNDIRLKAGEDHEITGIPVGSTIQVQELNADGYITSYNVSTKIEAENGTATGHTTYVENNHASGGYQLNNIGNGGSVTFPLKFVTGGNYNLALRYAQDGTKRQFSVTVNGKTTTLDTENTGAWAPSSDEQWKQVSATATMVSGASSIVVSGVDSNYAPNLDYIVLTGPEVNITDSKTVMEYVNGEMTIHFVNEIGYELPNSGGAGTYLYTMGGLLIMMAAAALLLYSHTKRGKEDYASS